MAEERLGASFSIDVSELKAGIAQANRLIRESESEFRAAAAGMDDWTESEDGLNAKISSLNTITDLQRKKVGALTTQYEQLIAEGLDPASREAVELRTKINQEMQALKKNERELDKQKKALDGLGHAADDAGKDLDDMGEQAKSSGANLDALKKVGGIAAAAIAAVGAAAAGAVTAFLGLAESTRETRTALAKVEQSFSTAELGAESASETMEELYGVLGDTDKAVEASSLLAKMSKDQADLEANTRILTGVFAEYGDSIPTEGLAEGMAATAAMGEVQGVLADALEWQGVNLEDFNTKLGSLNTEEERAALIQQTLSDLYGESADSYRENNKAIIEANEAQLDLTKTLAEIGAIAEPIMTTLKELTTDFLKSLMPFIELIGEGLTGALNGADGAAEDLANGIGGLISSVADKAMEMMPVIIDTISSLIPKLLESLFEQLPTIYAGVMEMQAQLYSVIADMLPSLIPLAVDAVVMIVEALLDNLGSIIDAGVELLLGLADGLVNALPDLIDKVPVIIEKLVAALTKLMPKLTSTGIELIVKLAAGILKSIPNIVRAIPQIIKALIDGILDYIPEMVGVGKDMLDGIFSGMVDPKAILAWVKDLGNSIVGGIKEFFGIHSPSTVMADLIGKNLALGIGEGFTDNIGAVNDDITSAMNFEQARITGRSPVLASGGAEGAPAGRSIVVNQYNNYSQSHSRLELYKTKQNTTAAVRLAIGGAK